MLRALVALLALATLTQAPARAQADDGAVTLASSGTVPRRHTARQQPRRLLDAQASSSSDGSGGSTGGAAGGGPSPPAQQPVSTRRKRCSPSLIDVARQRPELRQAVLLAAAGYNLFAVDGGKPFTVLAPTNAALQALAADAVARGEQVALQDGFYSVVLYNQIPAGAYNRSQLLSLGYDGLQTSLGRALGAADDAYTVSLDGSSQPPVATGGWPANNAQLGASLPACNGWLHEVDAVLLPTQGYSDLPRLVDDTPDPVNASLWALLDGSVLASGAAAAPAPATAAPAPGAAAAPAEGLPGQGHHTDDTDVAVSSGNGQAAAPAPPGGGASSSDASSSGGDGGGDSVLVIAASVAGAAVAACAAVVAVVLLRKRAAARRRGLARQDEEGEEAGGGLSPSAKRSASVRPVLLHVDA